MMMLESYVTRRFAVLEPKITDDTKIGKPGLMAFSSGRYQPCIGVVIKYL